MRLVLYHFFLILLSISIVSSTKSRLLKNRSKNKPPSISYPNYFEKPIFSTEFDHLSDIRRLENLVIKYYLCREQPICLSLYELAETQLESLIIWYEETDTRKNNYILNWMDEKKHVFEDAPVGVRDPVVKSFVERRKQQEKEREGILEYARKERERDELKYPKINLNDNVLPKYDPSSVFKNYKKCAFRLLFCLF